MNMQTTGSASPPSAVLFSKASSIIAVSTLEVSKSDHRSGPTCGTNKVYVKQDRVTRHIYIYTFPHDLMWRDSKQATACKPQTEAIRWGLRIQFGVHIHVT